MKTVHFKGLGKYSSISRNFKIIFPNNIEINDYVYIGPNCFLSAYGNIKIGKGTVIGPNLIIHTANHNYRESIKSVPYDEKLIIKGVIIGDNVWIGDSVIILPGVTIGKGSVIAAGSVVVKNVPEFTINGGNPCRIIKTRSNVEEFQYLMDSDKHYIKMKNEKV